MINTTLIEGLLWNLERLSPGDQVQINDWQPMVFAGRSDNYFLVFDHKADENGAHEYSVICKKPNKRGELWCAPDDRVFGYVKGYHFNDAIWVKDYLDAFETVKIRQSERRGAPLWALFNLSKEKGVAILDPFS